MTTPLLIEIAITMMRARLRQTLVAAIGVTFGIATFITLLSFMNGLNKMLDGLVGNRTPHINIYKDITPNPYQPINAADKYKGAYNFISSIKSSNSREEIYNANQITEALRRDSRVLGISRKLVSQVFFNSGAVNITGFLNGIDVEPEIRFYHFSEYITAGVPGDLNIVENSVIVGKPLAEKLNIYIGDVLQVTTVEGELFQLKLVGYYQSGLNDFDKTQGFASVETVQKILGKPNIYITNIQVKLHDLGLAPALAKEYAALFNTDARDIQSANAQFETGSRIRTTISYSVGITLLIVAGFGIYNILNMMIYEKMDTIAILKATGFAAADIKKIFLFISLSIGVFGGFTGLLLGNLLSHIVNHLPFHSAALPAIRTFPVDFNPVFYGTGILFSFITTFFAGWLPAKKAGKVDPVIIIRGR